MLLSRALGHEFISTFSSGFLERLSLKSHAECDRILSLHNTTPSPRYIRCGQLSQRFSPLLLPGPFFTLFLCLSRDKIPSNANER